jgi:hypothetical protein
MCDTVLWQYDIWLLCRLVLGTMLYHISVAGHWLVYTAR